MKYLFFFTVIFCSCSTTKQISEPITKHIDSEVYHYYDEEGVLITGTKRSGMIPLDEELNATLRHFEFLYIDLGLESEFYEITKKYKKTSKL